jgi:hypothetical protein
MVANVIVILLVTAGVFRPVGQFVVNDLYDLFLPRNVSISWPHEMGAQFSAAVLTGAQILFLACATLWVRRWEGWRAYMFRLLRFACGVGLSGAVVLAVALAYRSRSMEAYAPYYQASAEEIPVATTIGLLFLCTLTFTCCWFLGPWGPLQKKCP